MVFLVLSIAENTTEQVLRQTNVKTNPYVCLLTEFGCVKMLFENQEEFGIVIKVQDYEGKSALEIVTHTIQKYRDDCDVYHLAYDREVLSGLSLVSSLL